MSPTTRPATRAGEPLAETAERIADFRRMTRPFGRTPPFLIRGFDPLGDVAEFGRELIPRLKLGAL